MKRLFTIDTLAKRLFVLMWVALVLSHVLAFGVVRMVYAPEGGPGWHLGGLPVMPSLPPMDAGPGPRPPHEQGMAPPPPPSSPPRQRFGGLSGPALWLDYGIRLAVIAFAAWLASRWLAAPVRRLSDASHELGDALTRGALLPQLDETRGTGEVREAARVFNRMSRRLQEQFQARGLMIAAISHDLRTPLTRLRMRLESMQTGEEDKQRSVADIHEMNALIDTVLSVFRGDGIGKPKSLQPTDVGALLQALTDDLAEQGQPVVFAGGSGVAQADPAALSRVLDNLVGNAVRYGNRAEIALHSEAGQLHITVDDAGPGVPDDQLEAVFQPFYRVDASRNRHTGGAGLGLYIARALVERMGGTLVLSNRSTGGLRAELSLPMR
jgi:signal transduction histidine kinase